MNLAQPDPMRDASEEPRREGFTCPVCQRHIVTAVEDLFTTTAAGSPRRFCDPACRQAAYRRRLAGVAEDTPRQMRGGRDRRLAPPPCPTSEETPRRP